MNTPEFFLKISIKNLNKLKKSEPSIKKVSKNSIILGDGAILDSIAFVNFIVDMESDLKKF